MLLAPMLVASLALSPSTTRLPLRTLAPMARTSPVVLKYTGPAKEGDGFMDSELMDGFGGCLPNGDEPLGWKGAALAGLGTYLWYLGTNTNTNKEREIVEGPGVRRRNILLVVLLQVGAANFRAGTGRVCTDEERKELIRKKLEKKGFSDPYVNPLR